MMRKRHCLVALLIAALAGSMSASAYGKHKIKVIKEKPKKHKKHKKAQPTNIEAAAEPDKILYERALRSLKRSKYTEARLELQTLINTYPDSEYLAKAKLAIADSFYKQGGVANLTQAIDAYKSFIVFFPFLDEAQYAQMQVAMCHYRMMLKSDRDPTEAESAENEFQNFIKKYPTSPLVSKAEQDLRDVQEVLADGEYKIGRFYYLKSDYPAAAARLMEVAERYPLYSHSDQALWMLGDIYMRAKKYSKNEDDKNHWGGLAGRCYDRILRDYPLSDHATAAKAALRSMGMSVPAADPHALARMQRDQRYERKHHDFFLIKWPKEILESRPDVTMAARAGQPNLNPPNDKISATKVLRNNAPGPVFTAAAAPVTAGHNSDNSAGEAVPITAEPQSEVDDSATTSVGAQIISAPGASNTGSTHSAAPSTSAPASSNTSSAGASMLAPVGSDSGSNSIANTATPSNKAQSTDPAPAASAAVSPAASPGSTATAPVEAAPASSNSGNAKAKHAKASKSNPKTESTSKKKHGLHKLVPW